MSFTTIIIIIDLVYVHDVRIEITTSSSSSSSLQLSKRYFYKYILLYSTNSFIVIIDSKNQLIHDIKWNETISNQ